MMKAAKMPIEKLQIASLSACKPTIKSRLKTLGFLPGVAIALEKIAIPFSDYVALSSEHACLLIRAKDLESIQLKKV